MTSIYTFVMSWGETLRIRVDLAQASAPIEYEGADEDEWITTPWQTADARHDKWRALRLVLQHIGPGWYTDPSCDEDHEGQLDRAVLFCQIGGERR